MKPKLKPCPFCGGTAQDVHMKHESEPWQCVEYEVTCMKCSATVVISMDVDDLMKQKAIEKWNRRAE